MDGEKARAVVVVDDTLHIEVVAVVVVDDLQIHGSDAEFASIGPHSSALEASAIVKQNKAPSRRAPDPSSPTEDCCSNVWPSVTFLELFGRREILAASRACRLTLNIGGLQALDLRTHKAVGTPRDLNKDTGRLEAKMFADTLPPTWIIDSPPCVAFSALDFHLDCPRMDPDLAETKIQVHHLHSVIFPSLSAMPGLMWEYSSSMHIRRARRAGATRG